MIKLIGILVVALGFMFRLNTLLSVLAAGIITGLIAGFSFNEIMAMLGTFFIDNRFMTLPVILMMPVIGLLEKYGLQERAAMLIKHAGAATAGRVCMLYQAIREGTSMLGLQIGNHASMVRPLISPMAEGAAAARQGELDEGQTMAIRAHAAASENIGNFFADDILVAVGPVLLMKGFFDTAGVQVEILHLAWWGLPTALWVLAVGWWRSHLLDRRMAIIPVPDSTDAA